MGFLDKVFGSDKSKTGVVEAPPCPHTALVPRWDSVDDIGHEDRATHYYCESCGQTFSPNEAEGLKHTNTLLEVGPPPAGTERQE